MADPIITKIGDVSAYLDAVAHGFEGTRAEFGELLANSANYAQSAGSAASAAIAAAATATTKAGEATTAATAATAAQTQTEAAASQAITDISTARSGAISAVQTEGQSQTANARAQAQAAAQSATTASTKASEASASATSAGQSATNAAASAASAAQSASNAQDVLDSIPADYSDLSANVSQLQADLTDLEKTGIVTYRDALDASAWEVYGIDSTSGADVVASTFARLKTSNAFYATYDMTLQNVSGGVYVYVYQYNDEACTDFVGELSSILNFRSVTSITLPSGYWYRLKATFISTQTMTTALIEDLLETFTLTANTLVKKNADDISDLASQVTTNASDISTLEGRYYLDYGTNRNPNNDSTGYLNSSGALTEYSDWKTTDYCYVGDLDSIVGSALPIGATSRINMALFYLCTYNADKEFIEQVSGQSTSRWTVTDGVSYVRFSYHSNNYTDVMLEGGATPTPYFVAYNPQTLLNAQYYKSGANWTGKKWVCVGDSLTEVNTRTTMHYHDYINQATGITVVNMGVSGSGYARSSDDNKAFYQRISSCPTDADVVTIFGSFNDLGAGLDVGSVDDTGTTTIAGCINTTIDNLQAIIPLVNLGIVAPTPWSGARPSTSGNAYDYVEMLKAICERRSIPFLDLWRCSNLRPWDADFRELAYSKDGGNGTHPDENGHKLIAPRFKAFLESLLI